MNRAACLLMGGGKRKSPELQEEPVRVEASTSGQVHDEEQRQPALVVQCQHERRRTR